MILLGIETSCDETSAAVVNDGRFVMSSVVSSQIKIHQKYGGVVPEIASRKHIEAIGYVVTEALEQAGIGLNDLDGVCVTHGPGLVGALLVGLSYAKALAYSIGKPFVGVQHIDAHICANYLEEESNSPISPPFICLVVSGGHTSLIHCKDYGKYGVMGETRDDACGEAYDKIARALGLGYPGGPLLDNLAESGNENAIVFPQAMINDGSFDFSFSGLKSAVLNTMNKVKMSGREINANDVAASFQKAAVNVLTTKTMAACKEAGLNKIALAGGVACNSALRKAMAEKCGERGYSLRAPSPQYCTDNAAMVCACAYHYLKNGKRDSLFLNAGSNSKIQII